MQNVVLVIKPCGLSAAEVLSSRRAKRLAAAIENDGLSTWMIENCRLQSVEHRPNTVHVTMSRELTDQEAEKLFEIVSDIATG